jgi:hypothetical protein
MSIIFSLKCENWDKKKFFNVIQYEKKRANVCRLFNKIIISAQVFVCDELTGSSSYRIFFSIFFCFILFFCVKNKIEHGRWDFQRKNILTITLMRDIFLCNFNYAKICHFCMFLSHQIVIIMIIFYNLNKKFWIKLKQMLTFQKD